MRLYVTDIVGLPNLPSSRFGVRKWLVSQGVKITLRGKKLEFDIGDLPVSVRRAFLTNLAGQTGLPPGKYDEDAHATFIQATASMRAKAERKAAMACLLVSIRDSAGWPDRKAIVRKQFGKNGTSMPSLKRLLSAVKGVDPINYAPALLAGYDPRKTSTDITPKAWSLFMTILRDAGQDFPIIQAWRDVRDLSDQKGWNWPSYVTINRRWKALPKTQQMAARYGKAVTNKQLSQPALRDKTTIRPMQIVSLDGRTQDYWTDMGDGKAVRMTMITLINVASNMVLGYELAQSENALSKQRVIRKVCERFGIFDNLYTDNGSAFAAHLIAGGVDHKFRNAATNVGLRPPGICLHLGINLTFAMPGNPGAKIAERVFASLSRVIGDRPEFKKAHTGHNPGAAPNANVVPVPFAAVERVMAREIDRFNRETGRRSQGANGRSYQAVFEAGIADRIPRRLTARQRYLISLIYRLVAVNRVGRVEIQGWVYGDPTTQADLLPYNGKGQRIMLGRDPDDFSAPALAFDADGQLICEGIAPVARGPYDSVDGIRDAARNRKAARDATAKAEEANEYLSDAELAQALGALSGPTIPAPAKPETVVGGNFGTPIKSSKRKSRTESAIPLEFMENFDRAIGFDRFRK